MIILQGVYSVNQATKFIKVCKVFLTFKIPYFLVYTGKCNFFYAHKKFTSFPASTFTAITNALQNYTQISNNEFHPNRKINGEIQLDVHLRL